MGTVPRGDWEPVLPEGVVYCKGQCERGADTGYEHWQIMFIAEKKVSLNQVRGLFPGTGHYELTRSAAAETYVWKEDTRVEGTGFELGTKPINRNSKTDWDRVWALAKSGDFESIPSDIRVSHYRTLRTIRADYARPTPMVRSAVVYWGPTGVGKSRRAWAEAGVGAYPKNARTKWWDGYQGEEHVVIDEFRGDIGVGNLLTWLDRYPVLVEIKGSSIPLMAKKIWFTSNLAPENWYPDLDLETRDALMRRLEVINLN